MSELIKVSNLNVEFKIDETIHKAVKGVDFSVSTGQTVGLVGESGSGKSVTSLAIMGLLKSPPAKITAGTIEFDGKDLLRYSESAMRSIRGNRISMIFQEPMTSLNPVFTVGDQIAESMVIHQNMNRSDALKKSIELMDQVGIPNPKQRVSSFPHELSGGQRQRIMIAMAIACKPDLLIADEPTTALDVTIQKQILALLKNLQNEYQMGMLFITHDLAVISEIADDVVVMYRGDIVEKGSAKEIFENPKHAYTKGLLACRPSLDKNPKRLVTVSDFMSPDGKELTPDDSLFSEMRHSKPLDKNKNPVILEIKNLKKAFPTSYNLLGRPKDFINAVNGIDLQVRQGRTLGLVGESGCGKTTLGRTILKLVEPTAGQILYRGQDISHWNHKQMKDLRRKMQIVFQDPFASLNPRMTISDALMEPMIIHDLFKNSKERLQRSEELMERVGLSPAMLKRYPHEFSGGQRQRICIARALSVEPEFIICDESVSALDVSIQAQILNLLLDLQQDLNLTYIFISHDLAVVKFIADELAVMNNGEVIELASAEEIYKNPKNDYTKKLLESIPQNIYG